MKNISTSEIGTGLTIASSVYKAASGKETVEEAAADAVVGVAKGAAVTAATTAAAGALGIAAAPALLAVGVIGGIFSLFSDD